MSMNERGYGYQGLPSGSINSFEVRRDRDLEDYISRRVKAKVLKSGDQQFAVGAGAQVVTFQTVEYDTASLFDATNSRFDIPQGAEGDYIAYSSIDLLALGDLAMRFSLNRIDVNGVFSILDQTNIGAANTGGVWFLYTAKLYSDASLRPDDLVWVSAINMGPTLIYVKTTDATYRSTFTIRRSL